MSVAPLLRGLRVIDAASYIAGYRRVVDNRTKRGIALDLRQPEGRAVFRRLVERADVVLTTAAPGLPSGRPDARESIGALNVRLIYASVTAYAKRQAWGGSVPRRLGAPPHGPRRATRPVTELRVRE